MEKDVIIVNETEAIDLVCESFNSLPMTNHSWINENLNHYESIVFKDETKDVFKTVLRISEIDESDNASFECFLANEAGEDKITFELLVQTAPKIDSILIKTSNGRQSYVEDEVSVLENDEITFDCVIDGFPTPEVTWFKGQDEQPIAGNESSITIENVQESNAGNYRCLAKNVLGLVVKSFQLRVNVPPKVENLPQNLIKAVENEKVTLNCDFHGNPKPTISWFANDKPAVENESFHILRNNKTFEFEAKLTDSGVFTCLGINEFGSFSINFTVLILGRL
jgi:Immunoglobulin domain